jgi:adenylosuccinate synthase
MANTILVGAQWGDEGKGKIIDVLTEQADVVVRTQGGNNAGHTVNIKGQKYILHLVPSGILRKGKVCVIGNGVVVDPVGLVQEIEGLRKLGVRIDRNLVLSETAHVVLPYHRELDAQREASKGKHKIGTTKRGIGPAYGDKAARTGLRVVDLINPERFKQQLALKIKENNGVLRAFGAKPLSFEAVHRAYRKAGDYLKPFVCCCMKRCGGAMTSCSRARKGLSWTLITGPIRSSPPRTRPRAGRAPARASRRIAWTGWWA